jgi:hypothetical protein
MTTFNFSTGNPANLVGGGGANMTDIGGSLTDLRSFINGGSMDETNVPNLSAAFTTWKTIVERSGHLVGAGVSNYLMGWGGVASTFTSSSGGADAIFYLDPTDFNANTRTTQLRVRHLLFTNSVAAGMNFQPALGSVSTVSGNASAQPAPTGLATVTGTTSTFATPATNSMLVSTTTPISFPAAGFYCLFVLLGGAMAGTSGVSFLSQVQMRQS